MCTGTATKLSKVTSYNNVLPQGSGKVENPHGLA